MGMVKDENYDFYLILKNKFHFVINGIEYNKIMAHDLGRIAFKQYYPKLTRETLYDLTYTTDIQNLNLLIKNNTNTIVYSVDRKDYENQIKLTTENIDSIGTLLLANLPRKVYLRPLRIIKIFFSILFRFDFSIIKINEILFLTSRMVYYRSIHDQLEILFKDFDFSKKQFVAFNSAYTIENLMTQFFNQNGCSTFSLSHSFFVNFKKFVPLDIINGENIEAEKLLVWGNTSKTDLDQNFGVNKERILVAGNPKYRERNIKIKQTFKKCIVLLGRAIYQETNLEIVNILKEIILINPTIQFYLKLHLSLNTDFYKKLCEDTKIDVIDGSESLTDLFANQNYDFAIVNNSTAYYEAMYYDLICFRYEVAENEDFIGLEDCFTDAIDLQNKIEYFKNIDIKKLNTSVENLLIDTIGMGINNYKEILENNFS